MIELVDLAEEHRWQLLDWRNDPDVARYMYTTDPIPREVHDAWFTKLLTAEDRRGWAVVMDGKPVGAAFLSEIDPDNGRASWAFYLADPSTRGRGVGSAVEYLVLEHVFSELKLHKLCCEVLSFNQAVVAMHQKFGFEQEGLLREHWLRDGERVDVHVLAMFAPTWADRRDVFADKLRGRELIA
ncbi:UDP-4-amino-4,6-dideoxy-N-acetyl-beta-L-altrosamine N-acetyltransferase [Oryzihumus sp.]|uniref:UDP-4-amino-4, 6-dideoxy-N-acetyl-beta-L-altrosamine N-acetyltransferase n=1 Tax=Oryzihumus sp. TaxID=1968903 RepID=UPI002EDBA951